MGFDAGPGDAPAPWRVGDGDGGAFRGAMNPQRVRTDPRAVPICPLARSSSTQKIDENFVDTVADALRLLIKDNEIRSFILKLSRLIDEHEELILRMTGTGKGKKRGRAVRRR